MIDRDWLKRIIQEALREDIGEGDITTKAVIEKGLLATAEIIAKENGVLAGLGIAEAVFLEVDPEISFNGVLKDGDRISGDQVIASLKGRMDAILMAERVALNFLSLLSGVATKTYAFVEKTKGYGVKIFDTRKTTPLLRPLERYAVRIGGGYNHRLRLDDGIIIKDNHLRAIELGLAVERARKKSKGKRIEVEVQTLDQVREAILARPDIIMLDNMEIEQMREAVRLIRRNTPEIEIEASGGITLENVEEVAKLGVDMISIGGLTHSPKGLNFSLEITGCFWP